MVTQLTPERTTIETSELYILLLLYKLITIYGIFHNRFVVDLCVSITKINIDLT